MNSAEPLFEALEAALARGGLADASHSILALNQDRTIDDMRHYERLFEQTTPMRSQFKHLWRGAAEHRDSFGELPRNMPTTLIIDKAGALIKTIRGRVPAEIWDDIAELVLT